MVTLPLVVWFKYKIQPEFPWMRACGIAFAAIDFGGDLLFILEEYEEGNMGLFATSAILLGLACLASFCWSLATLHHWLQPKNAVSIRGRLIDAKTMYRRGYSDRQVTTCDEVMKRENEVMTFEVLSHNELM